MGTNRRGRRRRLIRLLAIAAVVALLAAACGSSDDDAATDVSGDDAEFAPQTSSADFEEVEAAQAEEDAGGGGSGGAEPAGSRAPTVEPSDGESTADDAPVEGDGDAGGDPAAQGTDTDETDDADTADQLGAGGATVTPTAADLGRKLIFTANVHVEVDDVAAASAEATEIVEGLGGFVFGQNTVGGTEPSSELVFKVLPDDFNATLEALGTVGELRNQSVSTDDVTERIVDLESRIEVADLGVARLRAALEGAATLEDYAEIERLLLDRESELEVMRGQLRTLEDRVDLATITLLLTQDRVENLIGVGISSYEEHNGGESCPGTGGSRVAQGTPVTICFEIINQGDQPLTDITLSDTVLEIDSETQLIEVFGSTEELAPGQSAIVAHEVTPERSIQLRTRVVATPIDESTGGQAGPTIDELVEYSVPTFVPDTDPGFTDGFSSAVDVLKAIWVATKVVIGFLLPLLVLVPFLWAAWQGVRWLRRRRPPAANPPWTQPAPPGPGAGPAGPGGPGGGPGGGTAGESPPPPGPPAADEAGGPPSGGSPAEESPAETTTTV